MQLEAVFGHPSARLRFFDSVRVSRLIGLELLGYFEPQNNTDGHRQRERQLINTMANPTGNPFRGSIFQSPRRVNKNPFEHVCAPNQNSKSHQLLFADSTLGTRLTAILHGSPGSLGSPSFIQGCCSLMTAGQEFSSRRSTTKTTERLKWISLIYNLLMLPIPSPCPCPCPCPPVNSPQLLIRCRALIIRE